MDWEAIGALGELLGAAAVLATLLYLAAQVRVARKATSAQLEDSVSSAWNREIRAWGENPEVAKLMAEGLAHYQDLPQEKKFMFHVRMDALIIEFQKQQELSNQKVWNGPLRASNEKAILRMLVCPGGKVWWEEAGDIYPSQEYWNALLREHADHTQPMNDYSFFRVDAAPSSTNPQV